MVLILIRATRKTALNCMSSLYVCLVPNVHCKGSQQLRTICTCVTDYTDKFDTHRRCKELLEQNWFSVSQPLVLCLRNAFDITIRQTIKRYYRLQQLELRFELQMEWCITHHIRAQYSTGPRSAVGNVSGYRCVSDCNSRGREFDPGPVPYFRGD